MKQQPRYSTSPAVALAALFATFGHPPDEDHADPFVCFALDEADLQRIAEISNKAATAQIERLKLDDKFKAIEAGNASIAESIKALAPKADDGKGKGDKGVDVEALIKKAREESAAEFKAALKAETDKREAAEKTSRDTKFRADVEAAVGLKGIKDPIRLADAVARLISTGKVKQADDGRIVFVKPLAAGVTDEIEIGKGLAEWVGTDEGKAYLPPKGAAGSGLAPRQAGAPPVVQGTPTPGATIATPRGPMTADELEQSRANARRSLGDALVAMSGGGGGFGAPQGNGNE